MLTKYEMETTINYNQEEKTASVYTCDKALIRKLDKLCEKQPTIIVEKQDKYSKTYVIPKKWVKISPPRLMSEENKQKAAERARLNFGKLKNE